MGVHARFAISDRCYTQLHLRRRDFFYRSAIMLADIFVSWKTRFNILVYLSLLLPPLLIRAIRFYCPTFPACLGFRI